MMISFQWESMLLSPYQEGIRIHPQDLRNGRKATDAPVTDSAKVSDLRFDVLQYLLKFCSCECAHNR